MTTSKAKQEQGHHYYAATVFGWKTADTRKEALDGLVSSFRSSLKPMVARAQKEGGPGVYIWCCRVEAPSDASYEISWYVPQGVEVSEAAEVYVTSITAKGQAYFDLTAEVEKHNKRKTRQSAVGE